MDGHDDNEGKTPPRAGGEARDTHGRSRPGDEPTTEYVDDYLRLEEHIQQLTAERRPRRPRRLRPDEAGAYQMAALFHSAAPGAAEPDPAFAARLRARLEDELPRATSSHRLRVPNVSRRGLLAGGLGAAATMAAGVVAGVALDRESTPHTAAGWTMPLVPAGTWVAVVAADAVPLGGVHRFVTDQLVGYVRHTPSGFEALSGACTHMGCLVAWNHTDRTFDCPCHEGRFAEDGTSAPASKVAYRRLPIIRTQVADGQVWVYAPTQPAPSPTSQTRPDSHYPPDGTPAN